jgi:hypothetical protein
VYIYSKQGMLEEAVIIKKEIKYTVEDSCIDIIPYKSRRLTCKSWQTRGSSLGNRAGGKEEKSNRKVRAYFKKLF